MSTARTPGTARRISGTILLALAPLLLSAGLERHLGHGVGDGETEVFADATHASQANHWEAAESVVTSRCPACVAPANRLVPVSKGPGQPTHRADGSALALDTGSPPDPDTSRSQRPRAPPSS